MSREKVRAAKNENWERMTKTTERRICLSGIPEPRNRQRDNAVGYNVWGIRLDMGSTRIYYKLENYAPLLPLYEVGGTCGTNGGEEERV
jgi:hypothetical protein